MLEKAAMLTNLYISLISRHTLDKEVNNEVEKNHQCTGKAGRYNKILIGDEFFNPILTLSTQIRAFHRTITVAWGKNNRALATTSFEEHNIYMLNKLPELEALYERNIVDKWDDILREASGRLGTMYNPDDYPGKDFVRTKMKTFVEYRKIDEARDWRLDLEDELMQKALDSAQAAHDLEIEGAKKDIAYRILEPVRYLAKRMDEPEKRFRKNIIEALTKSAEEVESLNFFNDPELKEFAQKARIIGNYDAEEIREDDYHRVGCKHRSNELAEEIETWMS